PPGAARPPPGGGGAPRGPPPRQGVEPLELRPRERWQPLRQPPDLLDRRGDVVDPPGEGAGEVPALLEPPGVEDLRGGLSARMAAAGRRDVGVEPRTERLGLRLRDLRRRESDRL